MSVNGALTVTSMGNPPSAENPENSIDRVGNMAGGSRPPAVVSNWNLNS
jgi:hypothetical protein